MIIEVLKALAYTGIPLLLVTYILISRAIRSERLGDFSDTKSLNLAFKNMAKSNKQKKADKDTAHSQHLLLNKWLFFGGGFYGLMALVTYAYIELLEIANFLLSLSSLNWSQLFSSLSIDMLVNFFVNSIMNLVDAFVWFIYWPQIITMQKTWIWLAVAYLAYVSGARIARLFPFTFRLRRFIWAKLFSKSK